MAGSGVFAMLLPFLSGGGYGAGLDLWLVLGGAVATAAGLLTLLLGRGRPTEDAGGEASRLRPTDRPNAS